MYKVALLPSVNATEPRQALCNENDTRIVEDWLVMAVNGDKGDWSATSNPDEQINLTQPRHTSDFKFKFAASKSNLTVDIQDRV